MQILPKSIEINSRSYLELSFIEKIMELFDKSITIFNEVYSKNSASYCRFLSNNVKKIIVDPY